MFFKLNNFDFPLYLFLLSPNLFPLPVSLWFNAACRSSSYVSVLSHECLSDFINVYDATVSSSNVSPRKLIRPNRRVCLNNVRQSKPFISSNLYSKKTTNICSKRFICLSDVCQSRLNVSPSKLLRPREFVQVNPFV